jgi:hypothetical protein
MSTWFDGYIKVRVVRLAGDSHDIPAAPSLMNICPRKKTP